MSSPKRSRSKSPSKSAGGLHEHQHVIDEQARGIVLSCLQPRLQLIYLNSSLPGRKDPNGEQKPKPKPKRKKSPAKSKSRKKKKGPEKIEVPVTPKTNEILSSIDRLGKKKKVHLPRGWTTGVKGTMMIAVIGHYNVSSLTDYILEEDKSVSNLNFPLNQYEVMYSSNKNAEIARLGHLVNQVEKDIHLIIVDLGSIDVVRRHNYPVEELVLEMFGEAMQFILSGRCLHVLFVAQYPSSYKCSPEDCARVEEFNKLVKACCLHTKEDMSFWGDPRLMGKGLMKYLDRYQLDDKGVKIYVDSLTKCIKQIGVNKCINPADAPLAGNKKGGKAKSKK